MPTKQCFLCKNNVLKNQLIAIVALPLKCTSDHGDYGLIGEFFDKERIAHYDCIKEAFPGLCDTNSSSLLTELYSTLKSLGETVTKAGIRQFINEHNKTNEIPGLITLWFTKRNVFGQKS